MNSIVDFDWKNNPTKVYLGDASRKIVRSMDRKKGSLGKTYEQNYEV